MADESFTEEFGQRGRVEVKSGRPKEFKGLLPELVAELYLALPEQRRKALEEQGLVVMTQHWSPAAKPSVTLRL